MSTLEERVAALEAEVQEMKYTHAARVDAFAAAQHHMHEELLAFRAQSTAELAAFKRETVELFEAVANRFDAVDERLDVVNTRLDNHNSEFRDIKLSLLTILDRLPQPPAE